ncbi:hypothetical protein [Burkholderia sp. LMU1-1-1.1]|uniref:hypothetical protein n=1 Tax=Burkholderia sp. LMU1-1-1.1 TaxID=3135266 RepID=UPI00344A6545
MKNKYWLAVFLLVSNWASAQIPPKTLVELSKKNDTIVSADDLTAEQRAYLWEKTSQDRSGFLAVDVDSAYLEVIKNFLHEPGINTTSTTYLKKLNSIMMGFDFSFAGVLEEDRNRYNAIYRDSYQTLMMLTRWEYKKSGAAISSAQEFFNQNINGVDAVLSLASAKNHSTGIWKLTWAANGVLYELYQSDKVDVYGKPSGGPDNILKVAMQIVDATSLP